LSLLYIHRQGPAVEDKLQIQMFGNVTICITITTNEMKTKQGQNGVEPLVVPSEFGAEVGV